MRNFFFSFYTHFDERLQWAFLFRSTLSFLRSSAVYRSYFGRRTLEGF